MGAFRLQQQIGNKLNGFRRIDDLLGQCTACRANFQVAEETDIDIIARFYRVHGLDDLLTFHDILLGKRAMKDIGEDEQRIWPLQISRRVADDKKTGWCRRERGCQDGSCIQALIQRKFCRIGFSDFSCISENNRHGAVHGFQPARHDLGIFQSAQSVKRSVGCTSRAEPADRPPQAGIHIDVHDAGPVSAIEVTYRFQCDINNLLRIICLMQCALKNGFNTILFHTVQQVFIIILRQFLRNPARSSIFLK